VKFPRGLQVRCGVVIALWFLQPWHPTARAESIQLDFLYPGGACVGSAGSVTAHGKFPSWPVSVWIDHPGVVVEASEEKGQLKVQVSDEAKPGVCWLRLYDAAGATKLRPLVLGVLPDVLETEPNNRPRQPQAIELPVAVHGRLQEHEDVDGFAVELKQGEVLVADMIAHCVLGSPMDGILQVCLPDGIVLAQDHDTTGLDPRLVFRAPQDGTYLVRTFALPSNPVSAIRLSGASTFVYRLTLTANSFVDHVMPMSLSTTQPTELRFFGWNLSDEESLLTVDPPVRDPANLSPVDLRSLIQAPTGSRPQLMLSEAINVVSADPGVVNDPGESQEANEPMPIDVPAVISARLSAPGEKDVYRFWAAEEQLLSFRVASRSLGYPVDPVLRLIDAERNTLQENDDVDGNNRDAAFNYRVPNEGHYDVSVHDLHGRGGFRFVYRLVVEQPPPHFQLKLGAEVFTVKAGESLEIEVTVDRQHDFSDAVGITVIESPAGVSVEPARSLPEGDSAQKVKLKLTAAADAPSVSGVLRIAGTSLGEAARQKIARFTTVISERTHDRAWLTVVGQASAD